MYIFKLTSKLFNYKFGNCKGSNLGVWYWHLKIKWLYCSFENALASWYHLLKNGKCQMLVLGTKWKYSYVSSAVYQARTPSRNWPCCLAVIEASVVVPVWSANSDCTIVALETNLCHVFSFSDCVHLNNDVPLFPKATQQLAESQGIQWSFHMASHLWASSIV